MPLPDQPNSDSRRMECPYCLEAIADGEAVVCESCGTAHHTECWSENGGCCVRNCKSARRSIDIEADADTPSTLVLSREAVESARPYMPPRISNPCMKCGRQVPEGELYCVECAPEPPENQDTRNAGPLLLMLALAAVVLAWILMLTLGGVSRQPDNNTGNPPMGAKTDR